MASEGETVTNELGGKQSFTEADFSQVPPFALRLLAQCCGFGSRKYGSGNWKKISIESQISHAMNHLNEYRLGDRSEPHLVNAAVRVMFALELAVDQGDQAARYVHPDMTPLANRWTAVALPTDFENGECSDIRGLADALRGVTECVAGVTSLNPVESCKGASDADSRSKPE